MAAEKPKVTHLRYVAVGVPDYETDVAFYGGIWGLKKVEQNDEVSYFAAEGSPENYILRVRRSAERRLDLIAYGAEDPAAVDSLAEDLATSGVRFASEPGPLQTPGGGYGFRFFDPDGRVVEISADVAKRSCREVMAREAIPVKLSHVVVNSPNPEQALAFYREKLGFKLSDWIPIMSFLRCTPDHHNLAIARGQAVGLNHVAFEVRGIDEMMRGAGRVLNDGTAKFMWGPGRHIAGDNTYYYFVDPNGNVSEYTAEVEQIYDDATWTPKLNNGADQWGTATFGDLPPTSRNVPDPGAWVAPPV